MSNIIPEFGVAKIATLHWKTGFSVKAVWTDPEIYLASPCSWLEGKILRVIKSIKKDWAELII